MAWYLSEGCGWLKGKKGSVTISNNSKEVIDEVGDLGKKVFGLDSHFRICRKENYDDTLNAVFESKLLARVMTSMCGRYSKHKKLPIWFMDLNEKLTLEFFRTYIRGDGNIYWDKSNKSYEASITTSSKTLFNQMKILMFKLNILPSCKIRDFNNGRSSRAYILDLSGANYNKIYNLNSLKRLNRKFLVDEDYIYILIRKIDKEKYKGHVHDLEVEGEHNYTSSCLVHNSFGLPMLEGMACGLPQMYPNHSTGPELIGEPKTGFLVDLIKMKNGQEFGMTAPSMNDRFWPDPIDMAEKMAIIYKDKKLREKFSKNGIKFAKKFDWQKCIIPEWINFFKYVEEFKEPVNYAEKKLGI